MNKIKDVFSTNIGFFSTYKTLYPTQYTALFDDYDDEILNLAFVVNYGEKYCAPIVELTDIDSITNVIHILYFHSWKRIKETLLKEYDVTKPYNTQLVSSLERDFTSDIDSNIIDTEQIYGFDSSIGQDDSRNTSVRNRDIENHETNEREQTRIGNLGNRNISDDIRKEINVRDIRFINVVLGHLSNELTLSVY